MSTVEAVQLDPHTTSLMGEEADTLRASYIRRLAAVLLQHIPAFWRLALSVFSGKFAKVQYSLTKLYICWAFLIEYAVIMCICFCFLFFLTGLVVGDKLEVFLA